MNIESKCEDQIDIYDHDLQEMSVGSLQSLLNVVKGCGELSLCDGCNGDISILESLLAKKKDQ